MANPSPSYRFPEGNSGRPKGSKNVMTRELMQYADENGLVLNAAIKLQWMIENFDNLSDAMKRYVIDKAFSQFVLTAKDQSDAEIAEVQIKSKEELVSELLKRAGSANESIQTEGAVSPA